eukprot:TRINITY_DN30867_c0_g1_i1.p1 TRINITY_DN30867_c0_g1~~TRINITY_DN30867_c0_g1_i1.p1  ORF type:complete len:510 (+),score=87.86 TRINITY_DN30867_c0_g1_i1:1522-3051(+)
MRQVPATGHLGAALGVPCVICFKEDGLLKTLHCQYKVHASCLKEHWTKNVLNLGRVVDIRCPAEITGCSEYLTTGDLLGVVEPADFEAAKKRIQDVDEKTQQLIDDLKRQSEAPRPMFECCICLTEHEVEGCCTLPCQHRFCFESLQYHFDIIVRERRLSKLACPADGCGFNLRSEEYINIFKQCLSEASYMKLLDFLTRDNDHIYECRRPGCEERLFLEETDDFTDLQCTCGHRFCAKCENGPHRGLTCEQWQDRLDRERKEEEVRQNDDDAMQNALAMGWKPCPKRCSFGGGFKEESECDHVTCECGHEFCWACGVDRQVPLQHDNRWHKPSCPYHTSYNEVAEAPRRMPNCPACQKLPGKSCCPFPQDDGYPDSYIRRRQRQATPAQQTQGQAQEPATQAQGNLQPMFQLAVPAAEAQTLTLRFMDFRDDTERTVNFTHKPLGLRWLENQMPITVDQVAAGGPAHRAGVLRGWFLKAVNEQNLLMCQYDEAADALIKAVSRLPSIG